MRLLVEKIMFDEADDHCAYAEHSGLVNLCSRSSGADEASFFRGLRGAGGRRCRAVGRA